MAAAAVLDFKILNSLSMHPSVSGLSGHDAGFLKINTINIVKNKIPWKPGTKTINNEKIINFWLLLKDKTLESAWVFN